MAFALALFDNISRSYEPVLFGVYVAFVLLFPLSVFGLLFFVAQNQTKSDKWFLGLPLLVVILISILSLYASIKQLQVPIETYFFLLALVAPASALFIESVPEELRESAKKYVKVAVLVSIYVGIICLLYLIDTFLLVDHPLVSTMLTMFLIYVEFWLPLIGICLVLLARSDQNGYF